MANKLPVYLIASITVAYSLGDILDLGVIRIFFTVSCVLKEILMWMLPIIIFSHITAAILSMKQRAPLLVISILSLVILSNAVNVLLSYEIGINLFSILSFSDYYLFEIKEIVSPIFSFHIPKILTPDQSMLYGIFIGFIVSFFNLSIFIISIENIKHYTSLFFQKIFIPLLPVYVFGFILKMQYEGTLSILIRESGHIFGILWILIIIYIILLYFVASNFHLSRFFEVFQNMIPAGITGFSTMSSAATMPVTLAATEKNTKDKEFTNLVIPATVNIHLIGDALAIPILALFVLNISGMPLPSFQDYILFIFYFCLAKFSVAGIPGGGIIVMIPILQKYLGLSSEMANLVATIFIVQDPIFTSANVMGNGAFALLIHKMGFVTPLEKTRKVV